MFKTIVLALDGSEGSRRAIPLAVELAQRDDARIVIAHVEQDLAGKGGAPVPVTEDEIHDEIRKQAEELSAEGVDTAVEMRNVMVGAPAHAIEANSDGLSEFFDLPGYGYHRTIRSVTALTASPMSADCGSQELTG